MKNMKLGAARSRNSTEGVGPVSVKTSINGSRDALKSTANVIISHFGMRSDCAMMQMVVYALKKRSRIRA